VLAAKNQDFTDDDSKIEKKKKWRKEYRKAFYMNNKFF